MHPTLPLTYDFFLNLLLHLVLFSHYQSCTYTYLPMKIEQTECSETWAYKIRTPGNNPEEIIQHSEHGESLKSRNLTSLRFFPALLVVYKSVSRGIQIRLSWYTNPSLVVYKSVSRGIQIRLSWYTNLSLVVYKSVSRGIQIRLSWYTNPSLVVYKSVSWYSNPSRGIKSVSWYSIRLVVSKSVSWCLNPSRVFKSVSWYLNP